MNIYKGMLISCVILGSFILLVVLFTALPVQAMPHVDYSAGTGIVQNDWVIWEGEEIIIQPSSSPTGTITYTQHLPVIFGFGLPAFELTDFWTGDAEGMPMLAFQPGEEIQHVVNGTTNYYYPITTSLEISQTDGSEASIIISETINLPKGDWEFRYDSTAPAFVGIYDHKALLSAKTLSQTSQAAYAVNPNSQIVINQQQGFDRCYAPTLEDMQIWWEKSPYTVFNLYIGGVSFACRDEPLDALWVHQAAEQGWEFILTWVGPQAPCSSFKHRMSSNPGVAYVEGKLEAEYAAETAHRLGFFNDAVIYYDIEGYTNDAECRETVQSFLQGWVEQLQLIGLRAGAYGSPCRSYITDWATIKNPPADIWIAHWIADEYDPAATVWDVPCGLENSYWKDHQRLKQYAGGHKESWGGVELVIDSNVLDGHITSLPLQTSSPSSELAINTTTITKSDPQIDDFGLINQGHGWILTGGRLLVTEDGGNTWEQHSPANIQVSSVAYAPTGEVWLVGGDTELGQLQIGHATNGSHDWKLYPFPEASYDLEHSIARSYIDPLDSSTAYLVFKLVSSSNFSIGRMFFTQDGGLTWHERYIPIGEQVRFPNPNEGWTTGGATGMENYRTEDGGKTWQALSTEEFALPQGNYVGDKLILPAGVAKTSAVDQLQAWAYVVDNNCQGDKEEGQLICSHSATLFATNDGGISWSKVYPR